MDFLKKISGMKTYYTALVMIITGIGLVIAALKGEGSADIMTGVTMIMNGFGLIGLRHGVSTMGEKVIVHDGDDLPIFDDNGNDVTGDAK